MNVLKPKADVQNMLGPTRRTQSIRIPSHRMNFALHHIKPPDTLEGFKCFLRLLIL